MANTSDSISEIAQSLGYESASAFTKAFKKIMGYSPRELQSWQTLMVEILKDNARPEAGEVYGAMDMAWAKLVGQVAQAYGK